MCSSDLKTVDYGGGYVPESGRRWFVFDNAAAALFRHYLTAARGSRDAVLGAWCPILVRAGVVWGSKVRLMDD